MTTLRDLGKTYNKTYERLRDDILASPGTRFALKDAIRSFDTKDPVDAMKDAILLAELMAYKAKVALSVF